MIHFTAGTTSKSGAAANTVAWFRSTSITGGSADFICDDATSVQYNPDPLNRYTWAVGGTKYPNSKGGSLYGEDYPSVLSSLTIAASVLESSNAFLFQFEAPADKGEAVQAKRAGFGHTYYDKYALPYYVSVPVEKLNIRKKPGTDADCTIVGSITGGPTVYTIVEVQRSWGRLKPGAGWIYLPTPSGRNSRPDLTEALRNLAAIYKAKNTAPSAGPDRPGGGGFFRLNVARAVLSACYYRPRFSTFFLQS